jgi:hypothetical protein
MQQNNARPEACDNLGCLLKAKLALSEKLRNTSRIILQLLRANVCKGSILLHAIHHGKVSFSDDPSFEIYTESVIL